MKLCLAVVLCLGSVWGQEQAAKRPQMPDIPDTEVVAVFDDGAKFTMGEFRNMLTVLPPEMQKRAVEDRPNFVKQWALMRKLAKLAETDKLEQQSPTKEMLEYNRTMVLMNAALTNALNHVNVESYEIVNYYNAHREEYRQIHLRAIYISFAKKLTEEQAREKGEKLLAEIRGGADFIKLVKENSDDETSRAKDGDFLTLREGDNIPDAMRSAVYQLKQGEVSDLVRQPNGFYIFRADEVGVRPLSEVRDEIFTKIKEARYREWLDKTNHDATVDFTNPAFSGTAPAASPAGTKSGSGN
ncbi:MAG TPA: peptidylprolyl isomerase [Bryobacteraceae bacterium]|nr:peptidylprolyl isomerase [Bryobacteraceae bacterium]